MNGGRRVNVGRWLFRAAATLSAVVLTLLITGAIAGRIYEPAGKIEFEPYTYARVSRGDVALCYLKRWPAPVVGPAYVPRERRVPADEAAYRDWFASLGRPVHYQSPAFNLDGSPFAQIRDGHWVSDGYWYVASMPDWLAIPLAAALPMGWMVAAARRKRVARRREAAGRCTQCGYDLRTHSGRCPECGTRCEAVTRSTTESPPATP